MRIAKLLAHCGACQQIRRCHHPTHTQTGREYFAQRPAMHQPIAASRYLIAQCQHRRWRRFAKIQIAIRIVFHHDRLVLHSQLQNFDAALLGEQRTTRVTKCRNDVNQLRLVLLNHRFKFVDLHTVGINRHA